MNDLTKRTWAEVELSSIRHNYHVIRSLLPNGCRFLGVVKADAYGHGAVRISQLLEEEGADYLAVSCLDEALELRRAGISMPVLILGHTPVQYTEVLIQHSLTQTVTCLAKALQYSERSQTLGKTLKVHLKLDTGMSRLGFLCAPPYFDIGVENIIRSCRLPNLDFEGIYTHFAVSDDLSLESRSYTNQQFSLFMDVISAVRERGGIVFPIRHCANSGAVLSYPDTVLDMVRPGLLLYGYGDSGRLGLLPAMRLVTTISTIKVLPAGTSVGYGRTFKTGKRTRIGVLAAGYADGIPRLSSNRVSYQVAGKSAPQVGSVCMDMCMIDLTDIPEAHVGSEVEIFGPDNSLLSLSEASESIPYELLCSVSKRVPRLYMDKGTQVSERY